MYFLYARHDFSDCVKDLLNLMIFFLVVFDLGLGFWILAAWRWNEIPFISSWWTDYLPLAAACRFQSLSDATHDVESRSTKDVRKEISGTFNVGSMLSSNCRSSYSLHWGYRLWTSMWKLRSQQLNSKTLKIQFKQEETEKIKELNGLNSRNSWIHALGGVYIPPPRLRVYEPCREAASLDKTSAEYQQLSYASLLRVSSIGWTLPISKKQKSYRSCFLRTSFVGGGCFASVMKAQAVSLPFTPVFFCACGHHQVGALLLSRNLSQLRNNKVDVFDTLFRDRFHFTHYLLLRY